MLFLIRPLNRLPMTYFSAFWLLITLMMLSSWPAHAEWVGLADIGSESSVYVDPDTIRRKGDLVKMWHLLDNKIPPKMAPEPYFSMKGQNQYDCAEERTRKLFEMYFSGNMGIGEQLYTNSDETRWEPVAPGSIGQAMWKVACNKK